MALQDAVFVLGAGASVPFGFPTGYELKGLLCGAAPRWVRNNFNPHQFEKFAAAFSGSMLGSIDHFLQTCEASNRKDLIEVGMCSIAAHLLPAEERSLKSQEFPDWYSLFFEELLRSEDKRKVQVLTFNYDRSFEYFFMRAFMATHGCSSSKAVDVFNERIDIEHVYGQLGVLPEFNRSGGDAVAYGDVKDVPTAKESFKLIGQRSSLDAAAKLRDASAIIFVGFGFLDENLQLLGLQGLQRKMLFSTGCGISTGRRWTLRSQYPEQYWVFGEQGKEGKARAFFHHTDLFRQLRDLTALQHYVMEKRRDT